MEDVATIEKQAMIIAAGRPRDVFSSGEKKTENYSFLPRRLGPILYFVGCYVKKFGENFFPKIN